MTRPIVRIGAAAGVAAALVLLPSGGLRAAPTTAPFSGSADASAVRLTVTIPGAPLTDTPVDGGGPTAQVVADSIGTSTGYAAFPDPGRFTTTIPGLVSGLLASGLAGLPPIQAPSLPDYPFYVSSDASTAPDASLGSGPVVLHAASQPGQSQATASAGVEASPVGNTALAKSTSSIAPLADGSVVASAVADLQGLTIGPLTIGDIKSTATETVDPSGTVTPSTALEIAGLRVGGVPVELTPQGFRAGNAVYPVPLNSALASLLKAAGITIEFVAPQQFPGKVIAPALRIVYPFAMPFAIPNVGKYSGTVTMVVGFATAQMSGVGPSSPSASSASQTPPGSSATSLSSAPSSGGSTDVGVGGGSSLPVTSQASPAPSGSGSYPSAAAPFIPSRTGAAEPVAAQSPGLDLRSLYLIAVIGLIVASTSGALIRRVGVRT